MDNRLREIIQLVCISGFVQLALDLLIQTRAQAFLIVPKLDKLKERRFGLPVDLELNRISNSI